MRHHAGEVLAEGLHLADEIELDARHAQKVVLQLPVRVQSPIGGRSGKSNEISK